MAFSPIFSIRCLDAVLAELYNQLILILLKKVTIQCARGGSPRRPGRAGKLAGRWGSYASRAAPTVGVGGARQRQESAWVPVGPGSQYSFRSHSDTAETGFGLRGPAGLVASHVEESCCSITRFGPLSTLSDERRRRPLSLDTSGRRVSFSFFFRAFLITLHGTRGA